MSVLLAILCTVFGAVLGSFAGAQIWRLRARQLAFDKHDKLPYDKEEYKRLTPLREKRIRSDRSQCLSCGRHLRWYDLVPVVSWLSTKGHCRYCHAPIGWFELVMEIGLAIVFLVSYLAWPWPLADLVSFALFAVWLASMVLLAIMAGYDARWKLLPDVTNYLYIALGAVFVGIRVMAGHDIPLGSLIGSVAILCGIYGVLYLVSRGAWIGLGDVKLGLGLALFLAEWKLAFLALFLANLIGCLIVLPAVIRRKMGGGSQIPFGPLLMAGMLIAFFAGEALIKWGLAIRLIS